MNNGALEGLGLAGLLVACFFGLLWTILPIALLGAMRRARLHQRRVEWLLERLVEIKEHEHGVGQSPPGRRR